MASFTSLATESLLARPAFGARVGAHGVTYGVWAPDHPAMSVRIQRIAGEQDTLALERTRPGYFSGFDPAGRAGDRYFFALPDGSLVPDAASRFQPEGVNGPSECIDPLAYHWQCQRSRSGWRNHAIYELHVGTFTPEGTFQAAIAKLDHVRDLNCTAVEIMPVADFPGRRNWGYDGVMLYAPARCYGRPDDLRALVDAAHARGLAVILDVVYNHFGPAGSTLRRFSSAYFRSQGATPWGPAFNLDGPENRPVRDFFVANAVYWIDEFNFDGLRLDATQTITDESDPHLLEEITTEVHLRGGFVTAEDDRNLPRLIRESDGRGYRLDAVWADDFHHQVRVALTGTREAYYGSFRGTTADLARTIDRGWFYAGENFPFWGRPRGASGHHLSPAAFIACIENHDQIGNRAQGERLEHLVPPPAFRAASALLCLNPHPPLIFMGQEWAAGSPFLYFTDHGGALGPKILEQRRREHASGNYPGTGEPPDPEAPETFVSSQLRWEETERPSHAGVLTLYRECLRQRASWVTGASNRACWKALAIGDVLALRFEPPFGSAHLLLVALHPGSHGIAADAALLHPPVGGAWKRILHSEEERFGGTGAPPPAAGPAGDFPGPAAALWVAEAR